MRTPRVVLAVAVALPCQAAAQPITEGVLSGWTLVDWTGKRQSDRLPPGGQVLVLADEIELEGATSQNPRNPRIVLIADHIKVTGAARINASNLGSGNDVSIVARRLTCDGGTLEIDVSALDVTQRNVDRPGPSYRDFAATDPQQCHDACLADGRCQAWTHGLPPGAAAAVVQPRRCFLKDRVSPWQISAGVASGVRPTPGKITLAVENETPTSCVIPRFSPQAAGSPAAGGPPRRGRRTAVWEARALLPGLRAAEGAEASGIVKNVGPDAVAQFLVVPQSLSQPQREKIVSLWVSRLLAWKETRIKEAINKPDYGQALRLLADARVLADSQRYPIVPEDRQTFGDVLKALNEDGRQIPAFVIEPLPVTTAFGLRNLEVWLETNTATAFVPPTLLLVDPIEYAGKRGLAYLSFDAARPDQLMLQINARLAQDPSLKEQVRNKLADKGWKEGALLPAWRYKAEIGSVFGVRDQKLVQAGEVLELGLTLDAAQGNVALSRLIASGINVELHLTVPEPSNLSTTVGVPLSLARASRLPGVGVGQGAVENKGQFPVRVALLEMADGSLRALDRAVELPPGQSAPLPPGFEQARAVPPSGAEYRLDAQSLLDYVVAADSSPLVETITITNLLGPDPARGGTLEYVEITVEYTSGSGPAVRIESLRLASRGTMGSERRLSFLRAPGDRQIRVEGRAYYEGGSSQGIGPHTSTSAAIKISEELFPGS